MPKRPVKAGGTCAFRMDRLAENSSDLRYVAAPRDDSWREQPLIGVGAALTRRPRHTTVRTGPYTAVRDVYSNSTWPAHSRYNAYDFRPTTGSALVTPSTGTAIVRDPAARRKHGKVASLAGFAPQAAGVPVWAG